MITFKHTGNFDKTEQYLKRTKRQDYLSRLEGYGKLGVQRLAAATPRDTGKTAMSWDYKIERRQNSVSLIWTNSNVTDSGIPIAILIQYGHGTRNGVYVTGVDYINPAIKPIFDELSEQIREEVSS